VLLQHAVEAVASGQQRDRSLRRRLEQPGRHGGGMLTRA
jgi:hypothetical protein